VTSWLRRKARHERAGDSGLETSEDTGRSQELSFVGEIAIIETEVTVEALERGSLFRKLDSLSGMRSSVWAKILSCSDRAEMTA